jgi:hypothetical protein
VADFAAAQKVKLRLSTAPPPQDKDFRLRPDVLIAAADLRPSEIQDLAEQIAEIRRAASPLDIKFHLRIELDGRGNSSMEDIANRLNLLLTKIAKDLSFK